MDFIVLAYVGFVYYIIISLNSLLEKAKKDTKINIFMYRTMQKTIHGLDSSKNAQVFLSYVRIKMGTVQSQLYILKYHLCTLSMPS